MVIATRDHTLQRSYRVLIDIKFVVRIKNINNTKESMC